MGVGSATVVDAGGLGDPPFYQSNEEECS